MVKGGLPKGRDNQTRLWNQALIASYHLKLAERHPPVTPPSKHPLKTNGLAVHHSKTHERTIDWNKAGRKGEGVGERKFG